MALRPSDALGLGRRLDAGAFLGLLALALGLFLGRDTLALDALGLLGGLPRLAGFDDAPPLFALGGDLRVGFVRPGTEFIEKGLPGLRGGGLAIGIGVLKSSHWLSCVERTAAAPSRMLPRRDGSRPVKCGCAMNSAASRKGP